MKNEENLNLKQKNILYYLFKASGRTFDRKKIVEKGILTSTAIIFTTEGKLNLWIQSKTNLGRTTVHNCLLQLKLDGYYHTEKINGKREFRIIIDKIPEESLVDATPRIPRYLRKKFYLNKGKFIWTHKHQIIYEYITAKTRYYHLLYSEGKLRQRITSWNIMDPKSSFYEKARTIANNTELTIDQVKLVLRQFREVFGEKAWFKADFEQQESRLHTFSNSYTCILPLRTELKKAIEKFEKRCVRIEQIILKEQTVNY